MIKRILASVMMLAVLQIAKAGAQVYDLQAIDSGHQKVTVAFDEKSHITISSLNDKIFLSDVNYLVGNVVLCGRFLKIEYSPRSGVGMKMYRTLIVCLNSHHLVETAHVMSLFNDDFMDFSKPIDQKHPIAVKTRDSVSLSLTGTTAADYRLNLTANRSRKFTAKPKAGYKLQEHSLLNFDAVNGVFFNGRKTLPASVRYFDTKTGSEQILHPTGLHPTITIDKTVYYFVDGNWFEKNEYGDFAKYSYQ